MKKLKENKKIVAVIIFSNSALNKKGNSNVTVDFTVFDPKGKLITKKSGLEVWVNRPAPKYRDLEMSVDHIALTIGDGELKGFYTVKALVHDKVARKTLSLEHKFEVID